MNSFTYYSAADLLTGTLINSRVQQIHSLSTYNKDRVVPDYDPASKSTYNGSTAIPSPARTWSIHGNSLSTYYAKEHTDLTIQGASVDITYQTSLNGAFAKHYIDGVNNVSISTYGALGGTATVSLPLTGDRVQDVEIVHSGFGDKRGNITGIPTNVVGSDMAGAVQITPNGTPVLTDTWVLTGINGSTFSLKRNSTGALQTLTYSTIYNSIRGNSADNGIPGFTLIVSSGPASGHQATIATVAPVLTIDHYDLFKNFIPFSGWQTSILDSGDQESLWTHVYHEAPAVNLSTYVSKIEVGSVLPVDSSWVTVVPSESATVNVDSSQYEEGFSQVVCSAEQTMGRYCRVTFSMNDVNQFIRYPQIFYWNPNTETFLQMMPPIVRGSNINKFISSIIAGFLQIRQKAQRLKNSMAVSTADQEYLIQIGMSLGFPIGKNESLSNYRNRLGQTIILATSDSDLQPILSVIQSYANSTAIYIVVPNAATQQWLLGSSIIGISSYLGSKAFRFWQIEIHTPGALPNLIPDVYEPFVRSILPIGCIPVFIYE